MIKHLEKDWITQGLMDYEYKKYRLLAYLQEVKKQFNESRLYPSLSDLIFHYRNLMSIKKNKELLFENFNREISEADFDKLKIKYKQIVQDDDLMQEIEEILLFSIPQIQQVLEEGKDMYEFIEEHLEISPVGIHPIRDEEGYFFIQKDSLKEINVYEYRLSVFENFQEKFRSLQTVFMEKIILQIGVSLESIKLDLIRRHRKLPHPATFLIYSNLSLPLEETLLPVSKRLLLRHIHP